MPNATIGTTLSLWKRLLTVVVVSGMIPILPAIAQAQTDTAEALVGVYEPNPAHPFGRLNPEAPPETEQFAFMLGEHDCTDRIFNQQDGTWKEVSKIWNGRTFLNGYAIRDDTWRSDGVYTTNIRKYDAQAGQWVVTFLSSSGVAPGVWKGGREGEQMVVRQEGESPQGPYTARLTFRDIGDDGFEWIMEIVTGTGNVLPWWTSSCTRRR